MRAAGEPSPTPRTGHADDISGTSATRKLIIWMEPYTKRRYARSEMNFLTDQHQLDVWLETGMSKRY